MDSCLHATVAELSGWDKDIMAPKANNIYYLPFYRKSFLTSDKEQEKKSTHIDIVNLILEFPSAQKDMK